MHVKYESVSHSVMSSSLQPMDCSLPGSSVHGISQARILEWVAVSYSRGSSWPRDRTCISCSPHWQTDSLPLCYRGSPCLLRSWPQTDLLQGGRFPASWTWDFFFFAQVNFDFYLFHSGDFGMSTHNFCRWHSVKSPLQLVIEWISSLI